MNEVAESIPPQWSNRGTGGWGSAAGGRLLMQASVRAVSVEMVDVLAQYCGEVARSGDQESRSRRSRRRVPIQCSAIAFARAARTGVRMMRLSAWVNTRKCSAGGEVWNEDRPQFEGGPGPFCQRVASAGRPAGVTVASDSTSAMQHDPGGPA